MMTQIETFSVQRSLTEMQGFSVTLEGSVKCKMPPKVDLQ
jgi:hypothetical protein